MSWTSPNGLHLVTGYVGEMHVTASNIGAYQGQLTGKSNYTLNIGNTLNASVSGSTVTIDTGVGIFQGRLFEVTEAETLNLELLPNNYYQNDLVVARYEKDAETLIESITLMVISGERTTRANTAIDPSYINNNIIDDMSVTADMPLFRIKRGAGQVVVERIAEILDSTVIDEQDIDDIWGDTDVAFGDEVYF